MDSRSLKLFLAVASHASIRRAAEAAHITQPALSKHMQRLEEQLGVTLFKRTVHGTELTAYGQALATHARTVVSEIQRMQDRITDLRTGRSGHVVIGAGAGLLETHIAPAVAAVMRRAPGIQITAVAGLADDLLVPLREGSLDILAGTRPTTGWPEEIACLPWFQDKIGIAVRRGHPLLRRRNLVLKDLLDCNWILPPAQHTFTRSCNDCFQSAGLKPPAVFTVTTSAAFIDQIVGNTDALTFMPLELIQTTTRRDRMTQLRVPGSTWAREVCLFQRSEAVFTPAVSALLEEMRAMT